MVEISSKLGTRQILKFDYPLTLAHRPSYFTTRVSSCSCAKHLTLLVVFSIFLYQNLLLFLIGLDSPVKKKKKKKKKDEAERERDSSDDEKPSTSLSSSKRSLPDVEGKSSAKKVSQMQGTIPVNSTMHISDFLMFMNVQYSICG